MFSRLQVSCTKELIPKEMRPSCLSQIKAGNPREDNHESEVAVVSKRWVSDCLGSVWIKSSFVWAHLELLRQLPWKPREKEMFILSHGFRHLEHHGGHGVAEFLEVRVCSGCHSHWERLSWASAWTRTQVPAINCKGQTLLIHLHHLDPTA